MLHCARVAFLANNHCAQVNDMDEAEDATLPVFNSEQTEARKMLGELRLFESLSEAELDNYPNWIKVIKVGPDNTAIKSLSLFSALSIDQN